MNPEKKDRRFHSKMKKQIAELLLSGQQPEDVEEALNHSISSTEGEGESRKRGSFSNYILRHLRNTSETDMGQMMSRKVAAVRKERQMGPEILLTLNRLGGFMVSHQGIPHT